jgi:hypothetical protein
VVLSQGVSLLTNLRFIYRVAADRPMEGKDLEQTQSEESDGGSEYSVDFEA